MYFEHDSFEEGNQRIDYEKGILKVIIDCAEVRKGKNFY